MGTLADIGAALNPEMAQKLQAFQNNEQQKSALMTLAQQAQESQQPSPQQLDQNGQPMNAQAQAAIAPFLQRLAKMNQGNMQVGAVGNNPASFQQAQQAQMMTQSPFASIQLQIPVQQQQADLANKKASTFKDGLSKDAAGNTIHTDADTGQQTAIGHTATFVNPDIQKLHELKQVQSLQNGGAYGRQTQPNGQQGQNSPAGNVDGLVNQAFMTDAQKAAAVAQQEEQAKAVQAAKEDVVNVNNMAQQSLSGIDQLQQLNLDPNLPRGKFGVSPPEQAHISNQVGQSTGTSTPMADAWNKWDQTNQGKLVGAVKNFTAGSSGTRMDLPIAKAITAANGATTEGSQQDTAERLNQYRTEIYNAQITAKNKLARLQDPSAPLIPIKPIKVPYNPKAQTFTMDQVLQKAQQRKMAPTEIINAIHNSGNWVQQE